jgi:hypothetical protein
MDHIELNYEGLNTGDFEFNQKVQKAIFNAGMVAFVFVIFKYIGSFFLKKNPKKALESVEVIKIQSLVRGFLVRNQISKKRAAVLKIDGWFKKTISQKRETKKKLEFKERLIDDLLVYHALSLQLSTDERKIDVEKLRPRALSESLKVENRKQVMNLFSNKEIELTETPFKKRQQQILQDRRAVLKRSILARIPGLDISKLHVVLDSLHLHLEELMSSREILENQRALEKKQENSSHDTSFRNLPTREAQSPGMAFHKKTHREEFIATISRQLHKDLGDVFLSLLSIGDSDPVINFNFNEETNEISLKLDRAVKVFVPKDGEDRTKNGSVLVFGPKVMMRLDRALNKLHFIEGFNLESEVKIGFIWVKVNPSFYDMTYISKDHVELRAGMLGQSEKKIRTVERLISSWGDKSQIRS